MTLAQVCVLLLTVLSALTVRAQFKLPGACPDYKFTNALETAKLAQEWYLIHSAVDGLSLGLKMCAATIVKEKPNGGFEAMLTMDTGNFSQMIADPVAGQLAKFESKEPGKPVVVINWVDGDSDNYAAVIVCAAHDNKHGHFIEVLSRKPTIEPQYFEKAKAALAAAQITDTLTANDMAPCKH